ncbi:unnamed protein product, partial [Symbiodinium necroappetens]
MTKAGEPLKKKPKTKASTKQASKDQNKVKNNEESNEVKATEGNSEVKNIKEVTSCGPKDQDDAATKPHAAPSPEAAAASSWPARSWPEAYAAEDSYGWHSQTWQSGTWGWGHREGEQAQWVNQWHGAWRRRRSSLDSFPDEDWQATPTPAKTWRRSDTTDTEVELDSGVVHALQRLRSFDKTGDLAQLAQSLEAKFLALGTPTKEVPSEAIGLNGQDSAPTIVTTQLTGNQKESQAEAEKEDASKGDDPSLTEKEAKKLEELQKRKKAAHARYMRYYRSVRESPRTPVEIRRMGDKAKNDSTMNSILFEAWEKCQGDWKTSSIYLNLKSISRTRRTGVRVWMTRAEVVAKFGETSADAIILRKQGDEKLRTSEIRRHPELPESDELVQYLILDTSKFVEEEEEVMEQLYQAADVDSSSSSSDTSAASKKKANRFNVWQ